MKNFTISEDKANQPSSFQTNRVNKNLTFKGLFFAMLVFLLSIPYQVNSQSVQDAFGLPAPERCVSNDLDIVSADLVLETCDCKENETVYAPLKIGIVNNTESFRTSFSFWAQLEITDPTDPDNPKIYYVTGCESDIPPGNQLPDRIKYATFDADNPLKFYVWEGGKLVPAPGIDGSLGIPYTCGNTLDLVDIYQAWTDASKNDSRQCGNIDPSKINPKCGISPIINIGVGLTASALTTDVSCYGGTDGSISISYSGGEATYSIYFGETGTTLVKVAENLTELNSPYLIKDLSGSTTGKSYDWEIWDSSSPEVCVKEGTETIYEPAAISLVVNGDALLCNGDADGNVSGSVSGGTAPYTVILSGDASDSKTVSASGGTYDFSGLSGGSYTVTVQDANYTSGGGSGCSASDTATITEPDAVVSVVANNDSLSCKGDSDGSIAGTVSGGTAPYTLILNDGSTDVETKSNVAAGSYSFDNYGAGSYTVTVQDANYTSGGGSGCSASDTATITEPDAVVSVVANNDSLACKGDSDGSIAGTVSGGTAPYTLILNDGSTDVETKSSVAAGSYSFDNYGAGSYTVTVQDANYTSGGGSGCSASDNATITEPATISLMVNGDALLCNGDADGNVSGSVSGGTAPYTVILSGDASDSKTVSASGGTYDFSGLSGGSYTVTVQDANYTSGGGAGCSASDNATITEPAAISLMVNGDALLCNGDADGNVSGSVSGGTAPYTVILSGDASDSKTVSASGGTYDFSGLSGGSYTVTVQDANYTSGGGAGCSASDTATITEPAAISLVVNGDALLCNGDADGNVSGSVSGGTAPYTVILSGDASDSKTVSASGGTYDFSGLSGGSYTVTVQDANYTSGGGAGCSASDNATITEPAAISLVVNGDALLCNGDADGNVSGSVSGGTAPYTVILSGDASDSKTVSASGGTYDFSGLSGGSYTVTVQDANYTSGGGAGCSASDNATITEPAAISLVVNGDTLLCNGDADGNVSGSVSGGTAPYTVILSGDASDSKTVSASGGTYDFSGLSGGSYTVTVQDANYTSGGGAGCSASDNATITEPDAIQFTATPSDETCAGSDGKISGSVSGGTSPYTVYLTGDATASTSVGLDGTYSFENLSAGSYNVEVRDLNYDSDGGVGCSKDLNVIINPPTNCAHIFPTDTSCDMYLDDSPVLEEVCVTVDGNTNTITNGTPGVFFFYGDVVATSTDRNYSVIIDQIVPSGMSPFSLVNTNNVWVYDANCTSQRIKVDIRSTPAGDVKVTFSAIEGQTYIISSKYDVKSLNGTNAPSGTQTYLFGISGYPYSFGGIDVRDCSATTTSIQTTSVSEPVEATFEEASVENDISVYPNPFSDVINVKYDINYTSDVVIEIFDFGGNLLRTITDKGVSSGSVTSINVDFSISADQMYVLRASTDREVFVKQILSGK
jgi:hypothetical protein